MRGETYCSQESDVMIPQGLISGLLVVSIPYSEGNSCGIPLGSEAFFIQNQGQWDEEVLFFCRLGDMDCWLTHDGLVYRLVRETDPAACRILPPSDLPDTNSRLEEIVFSARFVDPSPDAVTEGEDLLPWRSNFFLHNDPDRWATGVPAYRTVTCRDIYPGVSFLFTCWSSGMKYDIVAEPGADLSRICIRYDGVVGLGLAAGGDLLIQTEWGTFHEARPIAHQEIDGRQNPVSAAYRLNTDGSFGFTVHGYDPALALVIDPPVQLIYSTYLGGSSTDYCEAMTVGQDGSAFITGSTRSSDFPVQNPFQGSFSGGYYDAVISKLSAGGSQLLYSTYLGGSDQDAAHGIAVDSQGNAYIIGSTYSTDFPVLDPFQQENAGSKDAFLAKLSPGGDQLLYGTYLGGSGSDGSYGGIAVSEAGCAFITTTTGSVDFPVLDPFQGSFQGVSDAAVTKFAARGDQIVYSTYLGSGGPDESYGIAVDDSGCAYVVGRTDSWDFPMENPYQAVPGEEYDAFVTKFTEQGDQLVYSTYLGGSSWDSGYGIAVDGERCAYVTGHTQSVDFPQVNSYQPGYGGGSDDAFMTKFTPAGNALVYSTFLGGSSTEAATGVAAGSDGGAFLTGHTHSTDFPLQNAFQTTLAGGYDAFLTRFTPWGDTIYFSTYLGGTEDDYAESVAIDGSGCACVSGITYSSDFPVLNPFQSGLSGSIDVFASRFDACGTPIEPGTSSGFTVELSIIEISPNPFATTTAISFLVADPGQVLVDVCDLAGRTMIVEQIADVPAGISTTVIDGSDLPSGVYLCRLRTGTSSATARIVLLR